MLQKRQRNGADNDDEKETVPNTTTGTSSTVVILDEVVSDILCRIPSKSLMQFKCVSKPWRSLIQDPYFIDLHFTRARRFQRLFFIVPQVGAVGYTAPKRYVPVSPTVGSENMANQDRGTYYKGYQVLFKTTGISEGGGGRVASIIPTPRNLRSAQCSEIIGAVNGLICFIGGIYQYDDAACIYNISTREITPWMKSTVLREVRERDTYCTHIDSPTYGFGYDPATKKHKVLCLWEISQKLVDGTVVVNGPVCEVLTLGNNSWRKIEAAPPRHFSGAVCSVYVNGSIYWLPRVFESDNSNNGADVFMIAFDAGNEIFRMIQISKFRCVDRPSDPNPHLDRCHLLEVNGCVAILRRVSADIVELWIYVDTDKESTYKDTAMDSTDKNWTKNTIILPVRWVEGRDLFFHTASGTDQMILETHIRNSDGRSNAVSIYSYDLKKRSFEEIKVSGIPLSIPHCINTRLCISFCESLLS